MPTCPNCQTENREDRDFCLECGEDLRRDGDGEDASDQPSAAPARAGPAAALEPGPSGDRVVVVLREAGADEPGTAVVSTLAAGAERALVALIRNQGTIVDTFDLRVEGLPSGWGAVTPDAVHLLPFGSRARTGYEQEVAVRLAPPRDPSAAAREWPYRVVADSRSDAKLSASAPGTLVVEPYHALECELRPRRAAGTTSAHYELSLRNGGNASLRVHLAGEDDDEEVRFSFRRSEVVLDPGAEIYVELAAGADPLSAGSRERAFTIHAYAGDASRTCSGVFLQHAAEAREPAPSVPEDQPSGTAATQGGMATPDAPAAQPPEEATPPAGSAVAGREAGRGPRRRRRYLVLMVLAVLLAVGALADGEGAGVLLLLAAGAFLLLYLRSGRARRPGPG